MSLPDDVWPAILGPFPEDTFALRQTCDNRYHGADAANWPAPGGGPPNSTFLYQWLADRVLARGGDVAAAEIERQVALEDLKSGRISAVAVNPDTGEHHSIRATFWQGTNDTARNVWWTGVYWVREVPCDVYLIEPEPELAPEWWPGDEQDLKSWSASGGPGDRTARERLKVKGRVSPSEKSICRELSAMWRESGRNGGSPGSIETTRARAR